MRAAFVTLIAALIANLGCGTPPIEKQPSSQNQVKSAEPTSTEPAKSVDGLVKREIDARGVLFIRNNHGIGSYDAFQIATSTIDYERNSKKLPPKMEALFITELEQSLIDAAMEADISLEKGSGNCVLKLALRLANVVIDPNSSTLAEMTLVMEFRDSQSKQPLLRYATENRVDNPSSGGSRSKHLRTNFNEMVTEMNIAVALREAGLAADEIRPGCKGSLSELGRRAPPAATSTP